MVSCTQGGEGGEHRWVHVPQGGVEVHRWVTVRHGVGCWAPGVGQGVQPAGGTAAAVPHLLFRHSFLSAQPLQLLVHHSQRQAGLPLQQLGQNFHRSGLAQAQPQVGADLRRGRGGGGHGGRVGGQVGKWRLGVGD